MTDLSPNDEYERRFAGVAKIYGDDAFNHYEKSCHGDWYRWGWLMGCRSLSSTGVGELTLVDMDLSGCFKYQPPIARDDLNFRS
jgi:tRNA A37 threonylcarbamoyladenosine dehydratase